MNENNSVLFFVTATLVAAILMLPGAAAGEPEAGDDYPALRQTIKSLAPGAEFISVADSPVDGLLEVRIDSDIVYFSADGKILIQGRMYDVEAKVDLTDLAKAKVRKTKIQEMNLSKQIVFAPEKYDYQLIVFTDIDCGYCRKLHSQIKDYNDEGIAIRYMMFPRAGIGSHSYEKAVSVWCADDQQSALTQAKLGNEPEPLECENPVKNQYETGQDVGVSGTPALLTMEGQLIPGYVPPKALRQRLDALAAAVK